MKFLSHKFCLYWLFVCLLAVAALICNRYNLFETIALCDATYISWLIIGLFAYCSIRLGIDTAKRDLERVESYFEWAAWFSLLGILGTVLGFYHTFSVFRGLEITAANTAKLTSHMATGIGTAIVTTATGLICRFLLELQISKILK